MRRFAILLLVLIPTVVFAQSGSWGSRGLSRQFAVDGNLLLDADGRGLTVYDVGNSAAAHRTAVALTDDESLGLALLANRRLALLTRGGIALYAYDTGGSVGVLTGIPQSGFTKIAGEGNLLAASDASGVTVWRVNDLALEESLRVGANGPIDALAIHHGMLYVDVDGVGVTAYAADNPNPLAYLAESARDLAFSGDTLYIAGGTNGLLVADASDPASLRITTRIDVGAVNLLHVAADGNRVFAADGQNQVRVYDTSSAVALSSVIHEPADTIAASGNRLFVSGSLVDQWGLTSSSGRPVVIYDTTSASSMAGAIDDYAGPVTGVATDGTLAYVLDLPYLRVIDVSKTASPREIGNVRVDILADHVKVQGKQVILYNRGDVGLIDVSNPYQPKTVYVYHSGGRPPSNAAFAGDTIVEGNPASGFHVVDVTSYGEPRQIAGIKGHYVEVVAKDDTAFSFEGTFIRVVDLAVRGQANVIKGIAVGVVQADIAAATDNHPPLLLVHGLDGLHSYSLANRLDPVQLSLLPIPATGTIAGDGDSVWYAQTGSLSRIDVTNPARPQLVPSAYRVLAPQQVAAANGKVVVADTYSLRVFGPDTAPPPPPPAPRRRLVR